MANHCINAGCTNCGSRWCTRGCGFDTGPSPVMEARLRGEQEGWTGVTITQDGCRNCQNVDTERRYE